jgi:hypothetical protein
MSRTWDGADHHVCNQRGDTQVISRRHLLAAAPALGAASLAAPAVAQAPWPNRPIRLVVPYPPDAVERIERDTLLRDAEWQQGAESGVIYKPASEHIA